MLNLENKIFARSHPDFGRLLEYGFKKKGNSYYYKASLLSGDFSAELTISGQGRVAGKVFDNTSGEEYYNIWIEAMEGGFVQTLRASYCDLLCTIREKCFAKDYFVTRQGNLLAAFLKEKYGTEPEFLWKKFSGHGVFRHAGTRKWYGIIMYIEKNKLTGGDGKCEVLGIKVAEKDLPALLQEPDFYPAYHLNKKHWACLLLDGSVSLTRIKELLAASYQLVDKNSTK